VLDSFYVLDKRGTRKKESNVESESPDNSKAGSILANEF
jgi:hypothetical protein